ncbi:E-selectin-like isoform 4-T4 [Menidia menidia]
MWLLTLCRDLTSDNMWVRCLGFAVLVCTTGVLHGSPLSCGSNEGDTRLLFTTLDKCGRIPLLANSVFEKVGIYFLRYQCSPPYKLEGPEVVVCHSNGTWSQTPACTESCSTDGNNKPNITTIDKCGQFPVVKDGVDIRVDNCSLKYECAKYYRLEGPEQVMCHSDGTWSQIPTCRANYCSVNTTNYDDLKTTGVAFIANGETKRLECVDRFWSQSFALVACEDGTPEISKCCNMVQINTNTCWIRESSSADENNKPHITTIDKCGQFPVVKDGHNYPVGTHSLRFECAKYYRIEGPEQVMCYSDGTWSQLPTCRANYCSVNTAQYDDLKTTGVAYIINGEMKKLECVDKFLTPNYALVACEDGIPEISNCCNKVQIYANTCRIRGRMTDSE